MRGASHTPGARSLKSVEEKVGHRLLVTGAGTGASNNLIRSLKAGDSSLFVAGCHHDRFVLKKSAADRNFLVRPATERAFLQDMGRAIARAQVDLVIPTTDLDVRVLSRVRGRVPCRLFLPPPRVIDLCQDKYRLARFLRRRGVAAPLTYAVGTLAQVPGIFRKLGRGAPLWCRVRAGSGSTAA